MTDENRFWEIIDSSRQEATKAKIELPHGFIKYHEKTLADALRKLSPQEIVAFDDRLSTTLIRPTVGTGTRLFGYSAAVVTTVSGTSAPA